MVELNFISKWNQKCFNSPFPLMLPSHIMYTHCVYIRHWALHTCIQLSVSFNVFFFSGIWMHAFLKSTYYTQSLLYIMSEKAFSIKTQQQNTSSSSSSVIRHYFSYIFVCGVLILSLFLVIIFFIETRKTAIFLLLHFFHSHFIYQHCCQLARERESKSWEKQRMMRRRSRLHGMQLNKHCANKQT